MSGAAASALAGLLARKAGESAAVDHCIDVVAGQDVLIESGSLSTQRAIDVYRARRDGAMARGSQTSLRKSEAILRGVEGYRGLEVAFHNIASKRGRCLVWTDPEVTTVLAAVDAVDDGTAPPPDPLGP